MLDAIATLIERAPSIAPFYSDKLYRDLTGSADSVHLALYPEADESLISTELEERMRLAQAITSMVLALRRKQNIKVRQPLTSIMVPVADERQRETIMAVSDLIKNEVNVKELKLVGNDEGVLVKRVKPDFKKLGPKFGKIMKGVAQALTTMSQPDIIEFEKNGEVTLDIAGQQAVVQLADVEVISEDIPGWLVANDGNVTVALDITITDELRREGMARELVNRIQNVRKGKDFDITDRIVVTIAPDERTDDAVKQYGDYIARQVLADDITVEPVSGDDMVMLDMDGWDLAVKVEKSNK